jgi:hypothetical protein
VERQLVRYLTPFLSLTLLLSGAVPAQEPTPDPAAEPAAEVPRPGTRWTGRWIVHVERDAARHRAFLGELAALRAQRVETAVDDRIAAYDLELQLLRQPIVEEVSAAGAVVTATTWLANVVVVEEADAALLARLAARDDVALVQPEEWARAQLGVATDAAHHDSDAANLLTTPGGVALKGAGVTIGIIDSGVDASSGTTGRPHAAYYPNGDPTATTGGGIGGSRLLSAVNSSAFYPSQPAEDVFGHGTRMASIAGGARFNLLADVDDGPAPEASLRSYKISDDVVGGLASTTSMVKAFQDILRDPDVVVANMSYDGTNNPMWIPNPAIEDAALADVFVTLSAGNFGADMSFAHGAYNALVVGASSVLSKSPLVLPGIVTSAVGPLPDGRKYPHMLGVGQAVTCAKLDDEAGSIDSFGTSGGAALVAGSAALVRQADPSLTALEVKALLLNTTEAVTLGDPAAAGFGYLRTDLAGAAALAGDVVTEDVGTGQVNVHNLFLSAGDDRVVTLVWNRETSYSTSIDDLDVRVRDPLGQIIGWSASGLDNIEQLRFQAALDGVYKVEVVPISFNGDGNALYALAGVDTASIDPSSCTPGVPVVTSQSPQQVPAFQQGFNTVTLTGCNFLGVTGIVVGSTFTIPTVVDDNTLTFNMPIPPSLGLVPVTLNGSSGVGNYNLNVVAAPNELDVFPNILGGTLSMTIAGNPGELYVLAFSTDLIPTVVPGVLSLGIGNGGVTLWPFQFGTLDPSHGVESLVFTGITGPSGQYYHLQGVIWDPLAPVFPLPATNVATTLDP